ncbi:MAG: thioredoxin domain-containing protein, partial [Planctomycetales bacterium]|nr:thioredoxin domain-containing protein [Planctomycetales bacterium]
MYELLKSADRRHGGFGGAPKFPHPMDVRVLLRCWKRFDTSTPAAQSSRGADEALDVLTLTLDKMARGGIYDHLGGGFHRYSTDARWLVPHFEKMLYDNALLVPAYLELGQVLRIDESTEPLPFVVVRETLDYVLREMQQSEGGF